MRPGPALTGWAGDRAAQAESEARAAAVARAWNEDPARRRIDAVLDGDDLEAGLSALFANAVWLRALLGPLVSGLARDPFFQPPLRIGGDGHRMGMVLARDERATVTLSIIRPGGGDPATATAAGRVQLLRYIRPGGASVELRPVAGGPASLRPLEDGDTVRIDGRTTASALIGQRSTIILVSASLAAGRSQVVRIFDRATGALLRASATDEADSRAQLLLSLLRASGRADAADCFAEASRSEASGLRWEAMREWLLTDAAAALPRLAEMATGDPDHDVRAAAAATLHRARIRPRCPG
jgi:hypothetical protein